MKKQIAIRLEEEDIRKLKIYAIQKQTTLQALAEECLLNLIKGDNTMRTWKRDGYTVEEREFDYDLHKLVVVVDDEDAAEIIPQDEEDMEDMIAELDAGAGVIGWADGQGGDVNLPIYTLETEDPAKVALGDHSIATIYRTYSRKEAEQRFQTIPFDEGLTLILSKVTAEETECLAERTE